MKLSNLLLAAALLMLSACASATTKVMEAAPKGATSSTMTIAHGEDTVDVEDEYTAYFRTQLAERLYDEGGFSEAPGITLRYRFIQIDNGSRVKRYMLGPIAGKGTMAIEIVFLGANGATLSKVETGGEISGGLFGGSFKAALEKAAKETAEYALATYR